MDIIISLLFICGHCATRDYYDCLQTCLRDGETSKFNFLPLCDKQVIAMCPRAISLVFSKFAKKKYIYIRVKLILNCTRALAITYTNYKLF